MGVCVLVVVSWSMVCVSLPIIGCVVVTFFSNFMSQWGASTWLRSLARRAEYQRFLIAFSGLFF